MRNKIKLLSIALLPAVFFASCKDEDKTPEKPGNPSNPTEIITTVKLVLTEDGTGNTVTASWKDADGDGPGQPVISGLELGAGKQYHGIIQLLDESKSPVDTISNEVEEESDVHQFFYTVEGDASSRITISKEDTDKNNLPVGLEFRVLTSPGAAASGSLKVVLKHYDGVSKSNDASIGETDVETVFPVSIQ